MQSLSLQRGHIIRREKHPKQMWHEQSRMVHPANTYAK